MRVLAVLERVVNGVLSPLGVRIVRRGRAPTIGGQRLSDEAVIALARARGQSPGAWLEEHFGRTGRAAGIVERMRRAGALSFEDGVVVEIGPGSGLFVEELLRHAAPARYEIYELETSRAEHLARTYPVSPRETDGESLAGTPSGSVDLVHAHGVFVTLGYLVCQAYFREIERVTAPGGWVAFDIVTEDCLGPGELDAWLETPLRYLSLHPRSHVLRFFRSRGFTLVEEFDLPLLVQGTSRYFLFRRDP